MLAASASLFAAINLHAGDDKPFMLGQTDINQAAIQYSNHHMGFELTQEQTRVLVKKLAATEAINQAEINDQMGLEKGMKMGAGFTVSNPYYPRNTSLDIPLPEQRYVVKDGKKQHNPEAYADPREGYKLGEDNKIEFFQQAAASEWFSSVTRGGAQAQEVCAVKFTNDERKHYEMRTFASRDAAVLEGWTMTHQYQCGTCSTLKDLAVYIGVPNQTGPISGCTRQARGDDSKLHQVKQCIVAAVGFTEMCAETWAYNGVHTGSQCRNDCMAARGKPLVVNAGTGELNSCLWCDEKTSGPGFKYSAGRTRRGSGLESAIARPNDTLFYQADHSRYFPEEK